MAEVVAGFLVSAVVDRLSNILIQEVVLAKAVESQVERITIELRQLQASIEHLERPEPFSKWQKEITDVARAAEYAIGTYLTSSVTGSWRWIFSWVNRRKLDKKLQLIRNRIGDIFQEITDIAVQVQTPEAPGSVASPETTVARALEKLSSVLSGDLDNSLMEIIGEVRDDVVSMQKIVSNLRSTEKPTERKNVWLGEVNDVCGSTISVLEGFNSRRVEWIRMGWLQRLRLLFSARAPERKFMEDMKYVKSQIGGALCRGLTYGIEQEEGAVDKTVLMSRFSRMVVPLPSLKEIISRRVAYLILYAAAFPLFDMVDLPFYLAVPLRFVIYAIVAFPRSVVVDLWTAKPLEKLGNFMSIFWSSSIDFAIIAYSVVGPVWSAVFLQFAFTLYSVIKSTMSIWTSVDEKLESVQRDSALRHAFLGCVVEGVSERQRVWLEQIRVVDVEARALVNANEHRMARYRKEGALGRLFLPLAYVFVFTEVINDMLRKMHNIWERKIIYCISNMEERNGVFSLGQSSQGSGSEFQDGTEEDPLLAAGSNNLPAPKGLIKKAVESIREDMQLMEALFKDVENMGELDDRSEMWVDEMRGIPGEIEIVSNEYASKLQGKPIYAYIWNCQALYIIQKKINQIRKKIQDASRRRKTYGLVHLPTRAESFSVFQRLRRRTHPPLTVKESSIVGFAKDVEYLMPLLLSNDERHCTISIEGIGGTGKTTLARLIYNSNAVENHFGYKAWVPVPPNCTGELLLGYIAEQTMGGQGYRRTTEDLTQALKTYLEDRRCLIVVDGIKSSQVLDTLIKAIRNISTASRFLLTSRNANVKPHADPRTFVYQLQLLDDESSWALFRNNLKEDIPPALENVVRENVMKCGGLRSEIVKMSRLLEGLTNEEWSSKLKELNQDPKPWFGTLDTINLNLPLYLRRCLFYFVLFSAEFGIPARRLIAMWVAEGLVRQGKDKEPPEQVAERYLTELIDLNMVQIVKRKRKGKVKTCRLPNALRELWLAKANKSRFLRGHSTTDSDSVPQNPIIRRVADHLDKNDVCYNDIHGDTVTTSASLRTSYKDVLSFLSFDTREGSKPGQAIGNFLDRCISSGCFLSLWVLDLEGVYKPQLPENIGRLSQLRYLGLRWTYLESLPSSVSSLLKLQTLDLKHTYINILTRSIWKMQLRHLLLSETYRSRFPPKPKHNTLSDLQTLWGLYVDEETPVKGGLDRLVNIKKLGLACQSMSLHEREMTSQLHAIAEWIAVLEYLQALRLKSRDKEGQPCNLHLKSLKKHIYLTDIYLLGILNTSSIQSLFPLSLVELTLSHSRLQDDPMQILKDLPNLHSLSLLAESYMGISLVCESRSFPQLHVLKLWRLKRLEEWTIQQEALPCLRQLDIRSCESLEMLPDGLQHVSTLLELKLTDMLKIKSRVGHTDRHKISHIPDVYIDDCKDIFASQDSDTSKILTGFGGIERSPKKAPVSASSILQNGGSEAEICAWKSPPKGWVCLNSHGSVFTSNSEAACGGLVRDEAGSILGGFSANLGLTSITIVELWGVLHGLNLVWEMGRRKVKVDIDSQFSLSLIRSSLHGSPPASSVIQRIGDLLKRDWKVEFCGIHPEANRAADMLALMGHDLPFGVLDFISPPTCLADVIREDLAGIEHQRRSA